MLIQFVRPSGAPPTGALSFSERQPCAQLEPPRRRAADQNTRAAEICRTAVRYDSVEIGVVDQVESVHPDLQPAPFGQLEFLVERGVDAVEPRSAKHIPAQRAEPHARTRRIDE